jgi:signal transduction histidine kinase/DNA-binding response OmpR family regulator
MIRKTHCYILGALLLVGCHRPQKALPAALPDLPVCVLHSAESYPLQAYLQILTDTVTGYTIEQVVQPRLQQQFVAFGDNSFVSQSNQLYWGKIQLENRLQGAGMRTEWVLNFSSTFTHVTLFQLGDNGTWIAGDNGNFVPVYKKSFVPTRKGNWFKLVLPPGEVVTVYFRGESVRTYIPPSFHAYVQPVDVFYDKLVNDKIWSTLFSGLLLMMLFYNLLNYFFVKHRSYIYYSGYLLMVLIYTSYTSDDIEDWIGDFVFVERPEYFSFFKISLYLGLMCYVAFIRGFLDLRHLLPKWDRYFRYIIWFGVPMIALFLFFAFRYNFSYVIDDRPILCYIALVSISGFVFVYPLSKTKDPKGYFIIAGIVMIGLGFLFTVNSRMTQVPFTIFYLKLGTILEVLIFSMGLAYRQRQQELAKLQIDFALRESQLLQEKKQLEAERLRELNDFKSRFFTNITHEFRTPLTVMLGMSEQMVRAETNEPKRNQLHLIKRSGENLLRLVNQILDLAKLESNALKMNYVQGDILTFTKYIAESLHSLANAQNLLLRVESKQTNIIMDYDPERFLQIVHNLLSNAIKFTPSGGKVILRVDRKDQWLHMAVSDSGVGIQAAELPHLFEQFFQAQNQEHAKAGGTGIGLSLTHELVKALGGDISVESTLGVGTTFLVKLPVTNRAAFEEKIKDDEPWTSAVPASSANGSDGYSILLIEDNPDVVAYLEACFQGSGDNHRGIHLDFAYNGQAGVEKALETIPDLIISDVMMPIKDGFEVVEILKNDERTSHIPIILLTAKADVQSRLAGLRRGADAYLSKPFNQEELLVTVENLLEVRQKLHAKYQQNILLAKVSVTEFADLEDAFLQHVRAIVEENYTKEDFGLPNLCQKVGMSRSQLFRKMKALTDIAPSDLIRSHRLNRARTLLESGTINVAEAAWQVGFKDPSYFSKLYQEEFGEAPSATRN